MVVRHADGVDGRDGIRVVGQLLLMRRGRGCCAVIVNAIADAVDGSSIAALHEAVENWIIAEAGQRAELVQTLDGARRESHAG